MPLTLLRRLLTLLNNSSASLPVIPVLKIGCPIGLVTCDSRKSSEGCLVVVLAAVVAADAFVADASDAAVVAAAGTSVGAAAGAAGVAADASVAVADASAAAVAAPVDDGGLPHSPG